MWDAFTMYLINAYFIPLDNWKIEFFWIRVAGVKLEFWFNLILCVVCENLIHLNPNV